MLLCQIINFAYCILLIHFPCIIAILNRTLSDDRIVDGIEVEIEDFPYQISIEVNGSHICGGFLILPQVVVTAGHCVAGLGAHVMYIRAGTSFRENGGEVIRVAEKFEHYLFINNIYDYDVAVLLLEKTFTINKKIQTIQLANESDIFPYGAWAKVSGWGKTQPNGSLADKLRAVNLSHLDWNKCKEKYAITVPNIPLTDKMMCVGSWEGEIGACYFDSGGALVYEEKVIGIVSWGAICGHPDMPTVFASVPKLRGFIDHIIKRLS